MAYISDRQRVELALPARLLWSVVQCGYEHGVTAHDILIQIKTACMEPLEGLMPKDKVRLARRIDRLFTEVIDPITSKGDNEVSAGKAGLVIYYVIVDLVEQGILELYADTPMASAIEQMLPHLTPLIEIKAVDKSAQKQATKMIARLREMGYYESLRFPQ